MSKNTETRKKQLRYDRCKDPNTNCYLDTDGSYVFTMDVKRGNRWDKQEVLRFHPDDYPDGAEIILALNDLDYNEDLQEENLHQNLDRVFGWRMQQFENEADDSDRNDPWTEAAFIKCRNAVADALFPEEVPQDERLTRLDAFIATLQPQQIDLLYGHLGQRRSLEDLRQEEIAQTGKPITQQAFSDRWNKIITRACKYFDVPKPRKRKLEVL